MPNSQPRVTKNEKREAAREKARILREQQRKHNALRKMWTTIGVTLGSLGIIAVVLIIILTGSTPKAEAVSPLNMASHGVVVGSGFEVIPTGSLPAGSAPIPTQPSTDGKTQIVVYIDYLCPFCNQFEQAQTAQLEAWMNDNKVTVEYHPVAILSEYSVRAANAASCVVNYAPESFWDVNKALYANQPAESVSGGLPNKTLLSIIKDLDVAHYTEIEKCVNDAQFSDWIVDATSYVTSNPIAETNAGTLTSTPTIIVNGVKFDGNPSDTASFKDFVESTFVQ